MKRFPPFTPFLVTTFFVLVNHRELAPFVKWEELIGVWALALALTYGVYRLLLCFVEESHKAGLLAGLVILFFCFYGEFDGWLKGLVNRIGLPGLAHARYICLLLLAVFGLAAWLIVRARWKLGRFKSVLRVFVAGMVLATVLLNHLFPVKFVSHRHRPREVDEHGPFARTNNRPDIYYVILDCYASAESLKQFWNYDNSPFISFLESNGFFVVSNAQANYDQTPRCMASALNMAPIKRPPDNLSVCGRVNRMCEIIDLAAAPRKLQEIGYEVVNLSLFDVAGQPPCYKLPFVGYVSLSELLVYKSLIGFAQSWWKKRHLAQVHLGIFEQLKTLAAVSDPQHPRFIYAHILAPHWPYVFDRNGPRRDPVAIDGTPQDYLEQLLYVNQLVTNAVGEILAKSKTPPIIIVQGDHGFRYLPGPNQPQAARMILNAYHLPGGQREWAYDGITPVNSFRMVFNHYFGAHYSPVPDKFYHRTDVLPLEP